MHLKTFTVGMLCGMAAFAIALWILQKAATPPPADKSHEERVQPNGEGTESNMDARGNSQQASPGSQTAMTDSAQADSGQEQEYEATTRSAIDTELTQQSALTSVPVSDLHQWLLSGNNENGEDGPDRSAAHYELEAEPKDDAWAYYMEQALIQFLAGHPDVNQFEIFNIECRTTLCELQVIGFGEPAVPTWSQILYDMRQQPWFEFGETGSSSSTIEGRLAIATHLRRPKPVE